MFLEIHAAQGALPATTGVESTSIPAAPSRLPAECADEGRLVVYTVIITNMAFNRFMTVGALSFRHDPSLRYLGGLARE